jgi:Ca2+-binding RTX toxin-like protein
MSGRRLAWLLLLALVLAPALARAATLRSDGTTVTIEGDDAGDSIAVSPPGGGMMLVESSSPLDSDGTCSGGAVGGGAFSFQCAGNRLVATLGGPNRTRVDDSGPQDNSINVSLPAGFAIDVTGGPGGDDMKSTRDAAAVFRGGPNLDSLSGGDGGDTLIGGEGGDELDGGAGADTIFAGDANVDGSPVTESPMERDIIDCGPGEDTVYADPTDTLDGCENEVIRRGRGSEGSTSLDDPAIGRRAVKLPLTCNQHATCRGTAVLRTRGRVQGRIQPLGERDFAIASDDRETVRVPLTRKGRRLVRRDGKLKARVLVKVTGGASTTLGVALP